MDITLIFYLLFLLLVVNVISLLILKFRNSIWSFPLFATVYTLLILWVALNFGRDIFDAMNMVCIGVFVGGLYLLIFSASITWSKFKLLSVIFYVIATVLASIALDAFFIEPKWLEVTRMKIISDKVKRKTKIAIISDIQTDQVGHFEEEILTRVMQEKPDMIIFPGDYLQTIPDRQKEQMVKFNALMKSVNLDAPLGVFATEGDTEALLWNRYSWDEIFKGLPVTCFKDSSTVSNERFAITGLSLKDSSTLNYKAPDTELFHIWIGHRPGFSMDKPNADLIIAGHTHGGQVQLPIYGPVLTFSRVSREWGAGGLFELSSGKHLIVSRGLGMERGHAPRIRFFCRPQLIFLEIDPEAMNP